MIWLSKTKQNKKQELGTQYEVSDGCILCQLD